MITIRLLFFPVLVLVTAVLAGCNGSSGPDGQLSGPILGPTEQHPLDTSSAATQIALFVGVPVRGLFYRCADANGTRSTMTFFSKPVTSPDAADAPSIESRFPVARCGNDATSVSFYLGAQDASGFRHAVLLGKVDLPLQSAKGADGLSRYNKAKGQVSSSSFLFRMSVADMQMAPARIGVDNSDFAADTAQTCAVGKSDACQLVYKAALLLALDSGTSATIINIPPAANDLMAKSAYNAKIPDKFAYSSYQDFKKAWVYFLDQVKPGALFPPLDEVITKVVAGANRQRSGSYSMDFGASKTLYASFYYANSPILFEVGALNSKLLVYPNGRLSGFGLAASNPSVTCQSEGCAVPTSDYLVASGRLSDDLTLQSVVLTNVTPKVTQEHRGAKVNIIGRFFGNFLYDGRTPLASSGSKNDFVTDYPASSYQLKDSEKGSFTGTLFDVDLPSYLNNGAVGVGKHNGMNEPRPFPLRMVKSGADQLEPLSQQVLNALPVNYRVQLMRFCSQDEINAGSCQSVPNHQEEVGGGGNYPKSVCLEPTPDAEGKPVCADAKTFSISQERPRVNRLGAPVQDFVNLQVKKLYRPGSSVPYGALLELLDSSCQVVRDATSDAVTVGYVTATTDVASGHETASIHLLFSPMSRDAIDEMPQLGVEVAGRIALTQAGMPLYRLSDSNFEAKLRARWVDSYGYRRNLYAQSLNLTGPDQATDAQRLHAASLAAGAVTGQALNGACQPSI